jgi:phenylacetate-CoA ligase
MRQGRRLARLLTTTYGRSLFYTRKLDSAGLGSRLGTLRFPEDLAALPLTTKAELVADQETTPPWGAVLTEPLDRYTRYNQTSSTTGRPLRWLDTNESWQWMLECWKAVYRAAYVDQADRIFFAFSFGPFLGFWTAFDAACQRLALIDATEATVVCCTPTYALRLAEVAAGRSGTRPLSESPVRAVIVAGEPGGCIPATRERIEKSWGARVIDQYGLTEVGPASFECWENPGAPHLNENEFICEVLDPATHEPVADGQPGELVVTNLGRTASPVLRYRTGDIVVRRSEPCNCGRTFARLEGGILARTDDMVNIRGVNVYPTAVESIVHRFDEVVEFRTTVSQTGALRRLALEVELAAAAADPAATTAELVRSLREALGLNVPVEIVAAGTLPRFEMKARRFVVKV